MNASHSLFIVPKSLSNNRGADRNGPSSGGNPKKQDTVRTKTPTSHNSTELNHTTFLTTSNPHSHLANTTNKLLWSSSSCSQYQQARDSPSVPSIKRTSSRVSPHLSAATELPPTKRHHHRHQSGSELCHSSSPRYFSESGNAEDGPLSFSQLR